MEDRAQTAIEYVLILAVVMLVVVIAISTLKRTASSASNSTGGNVQEWGKAVALNCTSNGTCYGI